MKVFSAPRPRNATQTDHRLSPCWRGPSGLPRTLTLTFRGLVVLNPSPDCGRQANGAEARVSYAWIITRASKGERVSEREQKVSRKRAGRAFNCPGYPHPLVTNSHSKHAPTWRKRFHTITSEIHYRNEKPNARHGAGFTRMGPKCEPSYFPF